MEKSVSGFSKKEEGGLGFGKKARGKEKFAGNLLEASPGSSE